VADDREPDEQCGDDDREQRLVPDETTRLRGVEARALQEALEVRLAGALHMAGDQQAETGGQGIEAPTQMQAREPSPARSVGAGGRGCGKAVHVDLAERLGRTKTREEQRPREETERDGYEQEAYEQNEDHDWLLEFDAGDSLAHEGTGSHHHDRQDEQRLTSRRMQERAEVVRIDQGDPPGDDDRKGDQDPAGEPPLGRERLDQTPQLEPFSDRVDDDVQ